MLCLPNCTLPENLILKVVSEIHDPVTTTDELIPSGETSSYRSNPLGLAEFALSRKDPAYVGRAKEVQKAQKAIEAGTCPLDVLDELKPVMAAIQKSYPEVGKGNIGVGSTIFVHSLIGSMQILQTMICSNLELKARIGKQSVTTDMSK